VKFGSDEHTICGVSMVNSGRGFTTKSIDVEATQTEFIGFTTSIIMV